MLCVFHKDRLGTPQCKKAGKHLSPEEEDSLYQMMSPLMESVPRRHQDKCEQMLLGGMNGVSFVDLEGNISTFSSVDDEPDPDKRCGGPDGVFVIFSGPARAAEAIGRSYLALAADGNEVTQASLRLRAIPPPFAFVLYDRDASDGSRIIAARDASGAMPMAWGTSTFGEGLLFATDVDWLEGDCPDADQFPSGSFFVSSPGDTSGSLLNIQPSDSCGAALSGDGAVLEEEEEEEDDSAAAAAGSDEELSASLSGEEEEEEEEESSDSERSDAARRARMAAAAAVIRCQRLAAAPQPLGPPDRRFAFSPPSESDDSEEEEPEEEAAEEAAEAGDAQHKAAEEAENGGTPGGRLLRSFEVMDAETPVVGARREHAAAFAEDADRRQSRRLKLAHKAEMEANAAAAAAKRAAEAQASMPPAAA